MGWGGPAAAQALYEWLEPHNLPEAVALWLGSNLVPRQGNKEGQQQLVWSFDIQGAAALYYSYR